MRNGDQEYQAQRIALEEIVKTVEDLVCQNEERSAYVKDVFDNANTMLAELKTINTIVTEVKRVASNLKMLSLNTAIEAARVGDAGRGVGVIATEMQNMSVQYQTLSLDMSKLSSSLIDKTQWLVNSLGASVDSVTATSADLEEMNAGMEEVLANMDLLKEVLDNEHGQ